jgi:hypothetical protein
MGDSDIDHQSKQDVAPSTSAEHATPASHRPQSLKSSYVRPPQQRLTQDAIDDLDLDSAFPSDGSYTHDSNFSVRGATPFSGRQYRRSRSDIDKLQRDSQYGHYLQIPKGKRSIFISRASTRKRNSVIIVIVIVAVIIIVIAFAAYLILVNMS